MQQLNVGQTPLTGSRAVPLQLGTVNLTLLDAIDRGLQYNLGIILTTQGNESARAARIRALSELLPHVSARIGESVQQVNLAAYGIPLPAGTPFIVGPFALFDTRASMTENLSFQHLYEKRAADQNVKAAMFSYQNTRDLVVLVTGASYLQALSNSSRVESVTAQVQTAQGLYDQAVNLRNAGMSAGIDVLPRAGRTPSAAATIARRPERLRQAAAFACASHRHSHGAGLQTYGQNSFCRAGANNV